MDRYTKIVLTLIAGSLLWTNVKDLVFARPALAQASGIQKVVLVDWRGRELAVTSMSSFDFSEAPRLATISQK